MTEARDPIIGRTLDGRYRIEALVARGGMATVYVANDLRLRRNVAVKVMHSSLAEDPNFVHRFEREAHAAAQLTNPHVVAVHDQGRDEATGAIYLVMEYVLGRTVRELLGTRGPFTETQALAVLDPVLQALAAAHDAGYVHRDVKPENVLVGDDGRIKVTDFGLARAIVSSSLSAATQGVLIGTVAYLSPEQVERGYADARSDVYGAGVLLYEMLTGVVPHSGETPLAVAYQHVNTDVPFVSLLRPETSAVVDALVAKATRRDPDQRHQDAREFLAAVRAARAEIDQAYVVPPMPTPDGLVIEQPMHRAPAVETPKKRRRDKRERPTPDATEASPKAPRKRRGRLLFALLVVAAGVAGWWFTAGTHSTVPDVVGVPVSEAESMLHSVSLTASSTEAWNNTVPEGSVVDAQPPTGTTVSKDTNVQLVVSKGPERYEVPKLLGLSTSEAKSALAAVKLKLGDQGSRYDEHAAVNTIVDSSPAAGTVARPGDSVDVVLSKGPAPIAVPSVAGTSLAGATSALESAGFSVTSATTYSDSIASGTVITTEPGSGALLQRGSHVKIVVSKGPAPVRVPDVFKYSQSKAESTIKAAGLKVSVQKASGRLLNLVKSQLPAAGTLVPRGSTVTISIV